MYFSICVDSKEEAELLKEMVGYGYEALETELYDRLMGEIGADAIIKRSEKMYVLHKILHEAVREIDRSVEKFKEEENGDK